MIVLRALLFGVWRQTHPAPPPLFADVLITDLQHVSTGGSTVEFASQDSAVVAAWIRRQTRWDVKIPASDEPSIRLLGARRCSIAGRHAASALYTIEGKDASLVIVPTVETDMSGMKPSSKAGHFVDRCKGFTVMAWRDGSLTYAAVGKVSQGALSRLVPSSQ